MNEWPEITAVETRQEDGQFRTVVTWTYPRWMSERDVRKFADLMVGEARKTSVNFDKLRAELERPASV